MEAEKRFEGDPHDLLAGTLFLGMRFFLAGFDPATQKQVVAELEHNGGTHVGSYNQSSTTHVIVSQLPYEDPICKIAREHGKILLSDYWIADCLDYGVIMDVNNVLYKPLQDLNGIHGSEVLCICLTGYQGQARREIMRMVEMIGSRFTKPLIASKVTHLICYKFEGDKYNLAKRLGIKLVNHCWLEDCLKTWTLLPEDNYAISGWELEISNEEAKDSEEAEDPKFFTAEAAPDPNSSFPVGVRSQISSHKDDLQTSNVSPKIPGACPEMIMPEGAHQNILLPPIENQIVIDAAEPEDKSLKSMQLNSPLKCNTNNMKSKKYVLNDEELRPHMEEGTPSERIFPGRSSSDLIIKQNHNPNVYRDSPSASLDASVSVGKRVSGQRYHTPVGTKISCSKRQRSLSANKMVDGVNSTGKITVSVQDREEPSHDSKREEPFHDSKTATTSNRPKSFGISDSHHAFNSSSLSMKGIEVNAHVEGSKIEINGTNGFLDATMNSIPAYEVQTLAQEKEVKQLEVLTPSRSHNHACNVENPHEEGVTTSLTDLDEAATDNVDKENVPLSSRADLSSPKNKKKEGLSRALISRKRKSSIIKEPNVFGLEKGSNLKCKTKLSGRKGEPIKENLERTTAIPFSENIDRSPLKMEGRKLDFEGRNLEDSLETVCIANDLLELQKSSRGLDTIDKEYSKETTIDLGNIKLQNKTKFSNGQQTSDHIPRKPEVEPIPSSIPNTESGMLSTAKVSPATSMILVGTQKSPLAQQKESHLEEQEVCKPAKLINIACTRHKKGRNGSRKKIAKSPSNVKEELISKIQLQKHEDSSTKVSKPLFALSGHQPEKEKFLRVIKELGGHACRNDHQWNNRVTHVVFASPLRRTEKFFAAAAAGRWILTGQYLEASRQAGKFVGEDAYEWHGVGDNDEGTINLAAPRKWRLWKEKTGCGAFYGMRVLIYGECISPPLETLKRAIKAGGGTLLANSPPYTRHLLSGVDYAIVSFGIPREDQWVLEFLKHKVACVSSDYLVELICKPFSSLARHALYGSEASAEVARKRSTAVAEAFALNPKQATNSDNPYVKIKTQEIETQMNIKEQARGNDSDPLDEIACSICAQTDREDVMLLCGDDQGHGCGVAMHIDCCQPPLQSVPEEDWFCISCSKAKHT